MSFRSVFRRLPYRLDWRALATCAALALLGCERERVSVGTLPCSDDERVLCALPPPREVVRPRMVQFGAGSESTASIVWEHELPSCAPAPCSDRSSAYLVHPDGFGSVRIVRVRLGE